MVGVYDGCVLAGAYWRAAFPLRKYFKESQKSCQSHWLHTFSFLESHWPT